MAKPGDCRKTHKSVKETTRDLHHSPSALSFFFFFFFFFLLSSLAPFSSAFRFSFFSDLSFFSFFLSGLADASCKRRASTVGNARIQSRNLSMFGATGLAHKLTRTACNAHGTHGRSSPQP